MRELGDLAPVRGVVEWIEEQAAAVVTPPETVRLLGEIRKRLTDAIDDGRNPDTSGGVTVEEYARITRLSVWAVYKRIERGKLQVCRTRAGLRIPYQAA